MKISIKRRILGLSVSSVLLIACCIFTYLVIKTAFLTTALEITLGGGLLLITGLVFWLTFDSKKRVRTIIGIIIAVLVLALQISGGYYISVGLNTLDEITQPSAELAEIAVFVEKDDPAKTIEDAKNYTYGILSTLDRELTDSALEELNTLLGQEVATLGFAGVSELLDALLTEQRINAIVLNKSFLEILEETEGHEADIEKIRELWCAEIEIKETPPVETKPKSENIFTVYISGIDTSGSVSRRSRSDVNIIATVNAETGQILLLSTPRDYFVPLSISGGIPDKLTHAGIYGINVSKDTLSMLYDTEIDYYFRLNFDGFKEIIDALGGITVISERSFTHGSYTFQKGENFLNGEGALAFSRDRYHAGGDRQRGKNQMAVITAVINKATGPALLSNYKSILESVAGSFETSIPQEKIGKLVQNQLVNGTKWNVVSYSANGTGASRKPYSLSTNAYVMIPDQTTVDHAKTLIEQVKNGEVPTP